MCNPNAPALILQEKRTKFMQVLGSVLSQSLAAKAVPTDFQIHDKYIVEITGNGRKFSNAFFEEMFPKADPLQPVYHYTSVAALKRIALSGELHLYSVEKRLGQGELDVFARDHNLQGYLDVSVGGPFFKQFAKDLFYTSFARSSQSNQDNWNVFADGGKGVRLTIALQPKQCELRPIQYAQPSRSLLVELNKALAQEGLPAFVPWTISMIGAFYLPSTLQYEDEVRLLIKRHQGGRDEAKQGDAFQYWPLRIGVGDICDVQIQKIEAGPHADASEIRNAVEGTDLALLPSS